MTISTSANPPQLTVRPLANTTSFIHGELGISTVSLRGEVDAVWPATEGDAATVIPERVTIKLTAKEWTTADCRLRDDRSPTSTTAAYDTQTEDEAATTVAVAAPPTSRAGGGDEARVHVHSTLLRDIKTLWPPEAINKPQAAEPEPEPESESESETTAPSLLLASEAVQAAMARGFLHLPFELVVPDHTPGTLTLPHGGITYKLSIIFTYRQRVDGPPQQIKWHFMLPLTRHTRLPAPEEIAATSSASPAIYEGIRLDPFELACTLDDTTVVEATLPYPCLMPARTMAVQLRLRADEEVAASYADRLQHLAILLHRVDSYRIMDPATYEEDDEKQKEEEEEDGEEQTHTVSLAVEIVAEEHAIDVGQLTSDAGQTVMLTCPAVLLSTVRSRLLEVSYMCLVRLQLDDRAVEFFFPLDAVQPWPPSSSSTAATTTKAEDLPAHMMHKLGQLFVTPTNAP
ncbi:hypothetical protein SYNPS1DRAFT_28312 [Syncephalis pseudoplumigaleata]|uniref:Uncharacterized protein n=1 Tax=Syncephalis pseudoplumigaleata TaxID=1712513 RepID=A0A4P9Z2G3_9FUNG|nr:hypothetical protein SYNPS1DRAFT_28312 [Syncephalis pseudoplumigaleata]|eukprot:RKP25971.1 hypothetical protein SYNPS1DRAFT_28312 [Syncephalis pseudoplumigaleata]